MENPPPLPPSDPSPPPRRGNRWWSDTSNLRWFLFDPFGILGRHEPWRPGSGWWSQNWKWFVPIGCFFTIIVFAVLMALIGVFMSVVTGAMRSSEPHKSAVARAKADQRVTAALGVPISEGFSSGKTTVVNGSGEADLTIPISGPKGKGPFTQWRPSRPASGRSRSWS